MKSPFAFPFVGCGRRTVGHLLLTAVAAACLPVAQAQSALRSQKTEISSAVMSQMNLLLQEKEARTAAQAKLGSSLWYALQAQRGLALPGLEQVYASAISDAGVDGDGMVAVDITARVSDALLARIATVGGVLGYVSAPQQAIRASLPLGALEAIASEPDVLAVMPAAQAVMNVGAVNGQGIVSHKAKQAAAAGYTGAGVRVGVISDSVSIATPRDQFDALIASGDLPADTKIISIGPALQDPGRGSSEGTAMMEIIADMAPGAKLFFATALPSEASMADNIRALRAPPYNCDIIVDDVYFLSESAFQDGPIARAVNDVTAAGALYFSSAGNSGNVTSGTSGTWEGDFNPGPASATPLPSGYTLHLFNGTQAYDTLLTGNSAVVLQWSDPLLASANDHDLFVLSTDGTSLLCAATSVQSGTQDPAERCSGSAGSRIVVARKAAAAPRAIRLSTFGGKLSIATGGAVFGHNGGANTQSVAAVYWNSAKTGTKPFVGGAANPTEPFSSDGPRKVFYTPAGTAITPGNVLFATNGGASLTKPDIAAADGAFSKTIGFQPFFGTSAAAPHAAAIAALVKSARPDYTPAQIVAAMKATALDIRAPGVDVDSGAGIVMGWEAVQYALTH